MFGIPALYLKIAGWLLIVGAVYGAYAYVTGLQKDNKELEAQNKQVIEMNETLTSSIEEIQRMQENRDAVGSVSNEIRTENRRVMEKRSTVIDDSVSAGQDREVGPLLKEFFNAQ